MQEKEHRDETPLPFFSQNEKRDEKAMEAALLSWAEWDDKKNKKKKQRRKE